MPTIFVPSQQPTIAAAVSVAAPGDVIQLQPGYTGETATITVNSLTVLGDGSNVGISLTLGAGINDLALGGTTPINVTGNENSNTLIGNAAANLLNGAGG